MLTYKEQKNVARWFCEAEIAWLQDQTTDSESLQALRSALDSQPATDRWRRRLESFDRLIAQRRRPTRDDEYVRHWGYGGIRLFETASGRQIYQISIRSFPGHDTHCYYLHGVEPVLIDIGSGLPSNGADWNARGHVLDAVYGIDETMRSLRHLVISHGHVDHYGFLPRLLELARPTIYCHELDARVLEQFDERIVLAGLDLKRYLLHAGVPADETHALIELFSEGREYFSNCAVDIRLRDGSVIPGGGEVIHVPGHCAGLICIRFDDLLFTADHVLQDVTPHQAPQALNPFFGLEHYFASLHKIADLTGIRLALPSHGPLIHDLRSRIQDILYFHQRRLGQVLEMFAEPRTVAEIAQELFGDLSGYNVILGIEEAGAHVEYLHQHGWLRVVNVESLRTGDTTIARYVQDPEAMKYRKEPTVRGRSS